MYSFPYSTDNRSHSSSTHSLWRWGRCRLHVTPRFQEQLRVDHVRLRVHLHARHEQSAAGDGRGHGRLGRSRQWRRRRPWATDVQAPAPEPVKEADQDGQDAQRSHWRLLRLLAAFLCALLVV